MYVAMLWYGEVDLVSLVSLWKLMTVPLPCWSVLDHFKKKVKCMLRMPLNVAECCM